MGRNGVLGAGKKKDRSQDPDEGKDSFHILVQCILNAVFKFLQISTKKTNSLVIHKPLTFEQVKDFLNKINYNNIPDYIIQKLDIDSDGMISFDDLKAVLKRFTYTSFFKYTNDSTDPKINLYSKEKMSKEKFKEIVKRLRNFMKSKNITEIGLFKKFDKNNDGFFSAIDFNSSINDIIPMSPAMKDQFFNYLDFYHNGLVDCETFMKRRKILSLGIYLFRIIIK